MTAYYNENDPAAAAWLRELIKGGHIANGVVDERSILDVRPADLAGYDQCHFFAGIGGWSLALRLAGWPDDRPVWTGSCPCQPFSAAGKRKGADDERHLWPYWRWLIDQCRPASVFGEQVASKDGRGWLAGVRADLEALGYGVGAADLCAAGAGEEAQGRIHWEDHPGEFQWQRIVVGAPHIRQRIWWVADAQHAERRPLGVARQDGHYGPDGRRQEAHGQFETRGQVCDGRLADADGGFAGQAGAGRLQRGGQHGQQPQDDGAGGRPADADDAGPQERRQRSDQQHVPQGRQNAERSAGLSGGAGGVAEPDRLSGGQGGAFAPRRNHRGDAEQGTGPWRSGCLDHWSAFDLIPCADGKSRRIEPGTFPLAHGVPARVGRLRGYGNAIVPQVAAAFIESWIETREDLTACP